MKRNQKGSLSANLFTIASEPQPPARSNSSIQKHIPTAIELLKGM